MDYVPCPKCSDPVAGKLAGELKCTNCGEKFPFDETQVRFAILTLDERTGRWRVG